MFLSSACSSALFAAPSAAAAAASADAAELAAAAAAAPPTPVLKPAAPLPSAPPEPLLSPSKDDIATDCYESNMQGAECGPPSRKGVLSAGAEIASHHQIRPLGAKWPYDIETLKKKKLW